MKTKIQWAKGTDLLHDHFYIVGQREDKEYVIAAGPYTTSLEAAQAVDSEAWHICPEYCEIMVFRGDFCKGLRTWEDFA